MSTVTKATTVDVIRQVNVYDTNKYIIKSIASKGVSYNIISCFDILHRNQCFITLDPQFMTVFTPATWSISPRYTHLMHRTLYVLCLQQQ